MRSDVIGVAELKEKAAPQRLPVGFGLIIAVVASGGLWALLIQAARALF